MPWRRTRYFFAAGGSVWEAQATLLDETLALLHRIVCMLTKMAPGTKERRNG
jgi:hypothetical protein